MIKLGAAGDEYWSLADLEWLHVSVMTARGIHVGTALNVNMWKFSGAFVYRRESPWMMDLKWECAQDAYRLRIRQWPIAIPVVEITFLSGPPSR